MFQKQKLLLEVKLVIRSCVFSLLRAIEDWWELQVAKAKSRDEWEKYRLSKNESEDGDFYQAIGAQDQDLRVAYLDTWRILRKAERFGVSVPSNFKTESSLMVSKGSFVVLTEEGRAVVLKEISGEVSRRRKEFVQVIGVIIGLVGAVTGFVAVLSAGAL